MPHRSLAAAMLLLCGLAPWAGAQQYDLLIRNGQILDGTGAPGYAGDLAIQNGRIAAIGALPKASARQTIDAHGRIVCPGFIDMLGQSEMSILVNPHLPSKIYQGITTEITGEGESIAPSNARIHANPAHAHSSADPQPAWHTFADYFQQIESRGLGINVASFVSATTVRRIVLGDGDRQPTPEELARMQSLVLDAMHQGAVGLSTALMYAPAPFARPEELIALAKTAASAGGLYATHMRSEGDHIDAALDETFRIAREARIPAIIWHLKAAGKDNWGRMPEIVARINSARASGLDITANTYAYTAASNSLSAAVPPWAHAGGKAAMVARLEDPIQRARIRDSIEHDRTWDNEWLWVEGPAGFLLTSTANPKLEPWLGKNVAEIAAAQHKDPIDCVLDLVAEDPALQVALFDMSEADVVAALRQPWVSVGSDDQGTAIDGMLGHDHPHPRAYATFPHILRKYVREDHLLTLPEGIRRFTALPAQTMRLADRGVLKTGTWADIVIFDPDKIADLATYANPNQYAAGISDVLVNGVPVLLDGSMTQALPGRVLRGRAYLP